MNVLIAVDDSEESRHAVDIAYRFFGPEADYSLLSVGDRPPVFVGGYGAGAMPTAADLTIQLDAAQEAAERAVSEAASAPPRWGRPRPGPRSAARVSSSASTPRSTMPT